MIPSPELGLDLVRNEPSWQQLPRWDPRLWQRLEDVKWFEARPARSAQAVTEAGLKWARHHLARRKDERNQLDDLAQTLKQGTARPSRGRPQLARTDAGEGQDARRPKAEHGTGWAGREVGLVYFGKRYLSTRSADHVGGTGTQKVLDSFGDQVKAIKGNWQYGSNLQAFDAAVAKRATPEQAAFDTWTRQQAKAAGFDHVRVLENSGSTADGNRSVKVEFTKGK